MYHLGNILKTETSRLFPCFFALPQQLSCKQRLGRPDCPSSPRICCSKTSPQHRDRDHGRQPGCSKKWLGELQRRLSPRVAPQWHQNSTKYKFKLIDELMAFQLVPKTWTHFLAIESYIKLPFFWAESSTSTWRPSDVFPSNHHFNSRRRCPVGTHQEAQEEWDKNHRARQKVAQLQNLATEATTCYKHEMYLWNGWVKS